MPCPYDCGESDEDIMKCPACGACVSCHVENDGCYTGE